MTAHIVRPGAAAPAEYDEGGHSGLMIFAAVVVSILGFSNLLDKIAAIAKSSVFIGNARYVFGDLRARGSGSRAPYTRSPGPGTG
jgi:hypothetical protein